MRSPLALAFHIILFVGEKVTTPHFHTGPATLGPSLELVQTASFLSTHSIVDKACV